MSSDDDTVESDGAERNRAKAFVDCSPAKVTKIASLILRGISLVRMLSLNYDTRSKVPQRHKKTLRGWPRQRDTSDPCHTLYTCVAPSGVVAPKCAVAFAIDARYFGCKLLGFRDLLLPEASRRRLIVVVNGTHARLPD